MSNKRNIIETKLEAKELYHIMSWVFVISFVGALIVILTASIGKQYTIRVLLSGYAFVAIYSFMQSIHYYKRMNTN